MKISFIGTGNMASAIIKGIIKELVRPEEVFGFDVFEEKAQSLSEEFGINTVSSAKEAAICADVVVLSVKPYDFPALLADIGEELKANNPLIISIAAGKSTESIESLLPYKPKLVRIMPNINAAIGEAMSAYCTNGNVPEAEEAFAASLAGAIGKAVKLDEKFFSAFVVIAGSAPAFAYMFIDQLARAGVKIGLNKKLALELAVQTVLGSAKMIEQSDEHPYELIDKVCSPKGTTIEGIAALQELGFENAVTQAVVRTYERDKKIAEGK